MSLPRVKIQSYSSEYRSKVKDVVMNIQKFYPEIEKWWEGKEVKKIEDGRDLCLMLLDDKKDVVGIAISGLECEGIAKLKTFYLTEQVVRHSLGVKLLKRVLNYWMEKRVRSIFVTFAEEEFDELRGFFDKFGFLLDGFNPQFYRLGKTEFIMSKTFVYDEINEDSFEVFVRDYFLRMRGINPKTGGLEFVAYEDTGFTKTPRNVFIKIIKGRNVESEKLFDDILQKIDETNSLYGIIISYYPIMEEAKDKRIKVVDGFMLETFFYPLQLKKEGMNGVMMPVEEKYADRLLDNLIDEPQERITEDRVAIRYEKHFFSGRTEELSKIQSNLQRGGVFIFFQIKKGIIGEAKIKLLSIEEAKGVLKKYRLEKSAFKTEDELMSHSNKGKIALFLLNCVKRYPKKVFTPEIYKLLPELGDINFPCQPLTQDQIERIRDFAENNLNCY